MTRAHAAILDIDRAARVEPSDNTYEAAWDDLISALEAGDTFPRIELVGHSIYTCRRHPFVTWHLRTALNDPGRVLEVARYLHGFKTHVYSAT